MSFTIKQIYNETEIQIDSCGIAFGSISWWNFPLTVSVIGIESMARLLYTQDYSTPGICSLIKPAAMENLMLFRVKIQTAMLW